MVDRIKSYKVIQNEPPIIECTFHPVHSDILSKYKTIDKLEQLSFENLIVYKGRQQVKKEYREESEYLLIQHHFKVYKEVTKIFLELDKIRYPIHYGFDDWWRENNLDHWSKQAYMLISDFKDWSQPWHLDNRFSFWAGSINLQDNHTTTIFSHENHNWEDEGTDASKYYYKANGTAFTGTFWTNTEKTYHAVPKVLDAQRCTALLGMYLAG